MRYEVKRDYSSMVNGVRYALAKGDVVKLDPAFAEWLNRDSPGVVAVYEEPKPKAQTMSAKNRQVKAATTRKAEDD